MAFITKTHVLKRQKLVLAALLFCCALVKPCHCTITTFTQKQQELNEYDSMPALFGRKLDNSMEYHAHLAFVESDIYLCGKGSFHSDRHSPQTHYLPQTQNILRHNSDDKTQSTLTRISLLSRSEGTELDVKEESPTMNGIKHVDRGILEDQENSFVPSVDGMPVALLAKRGQCSFEAKALTVMTYYYPHVRYVIVYDDKTEEENVPSVIGRKTGHEYLVSMSASDGSNIDISLFFVSLKTGLALMQRIHDQSTLEAKSGGNMITLDSTAPYAIVDYGEAHEWMLGIIAGFFVVLSCFGCLLTCSHAGYIHLDGNVVVIGARPLQQRPTSGGSAPLLTEAQVLALPEIKYVYCGNASKMSGTTGQKTGVRSEESFADSSDLRFDKKVRAKESKAITNNDKKAEGNDKASRLTRPDTSKNPPDTEQSSGSLLLERNWNAMSSHIACSICLEEYEEGEMVRALPCQHIFHTECIVPWLTERFSNCPLCKANVESDVPSSEDASQVSETSWQGLDWIRGWETGRDQLRLWMRRGRRLDGQGDANASLLQTPLLHNPRSPPPASSRDSGSLDITISE